MAVRIRLTRYGRKNRPYYRIAVFDTRTRRDGKYIEALGTYDPLVAEAEKKVVWKEERLKYWVSRGAKLTPAVKALLSHTKGLKYKDLPVV